MSIALNYEDHSAEFSTVENMTTAIRYVVHNGIQPSFADLAEIPHFVGPTPFGLTKRNIMFWPAMSDIAIEAMSNLLRGDDITLLPCRAEVYAFADFPMPKAPIAEGWDRRDSIHWVPTLVVTQAHKDGRKHA